MRNFNPRTPGGVRQPLLCMLYPNIEFQSTHPGWGATLPRLVTWTIRQISIHAPRVGCDRPRLAVLDLTLHISIHAPRVGCDCAAPPSSSRKIYFNPRTPGGVRHYKSQKNEVKYKFQSTHPGWGATDGFSAIIGFVGISIHAPRVGCDTFLNDE